MLNDMTNIDKENKTGYRIELRLRGILNQQIMV